MKQLLKMMVLGTVTAFLLGLGLATLFWGYLKAESISDQLFNAVAVSSPESQLPSEPDPALATQAELATLDVEAQSRRQIYEEQISTLQTSLQEREMGYQTQLNQVNEQLAAYQLTINQVQAEVDALNTQATQLEQTVAERLTIYQTQLDETVRQVNDRRSALQEQLATIRQALAEANARLDQNAN